LAKEYAQNQDEDRVMKNRISVVVITYNRPDAVKAAVNSLLNQSLEPFEIILIDNGSSSPLRLETIDARRLKLVRLNQLVGLSNARNYGIKIAKGEYFAFIDDDCIPSIQWLEEVQKGIEAGYDILGGPLRPKFMATPPEWWTEEEFGYCAGVGNAKTQEIWGGNLIIRKAVFDKIGFFNTRIGRQKGKLLGREEVELISKAKSYFKLLFLPKAVVFHQVPSERMTFRYITRLNYYIGKTAKLESKNKHMESIIYFLMPIIMKKFSPSKFSPSKISPQSKRIKKIAGMAQLFGRIV